MYGTWIHQIADGEASRSMKSDGIAAVMGDRGQSKSSGHCPQLQSQMYAKVQNHMTEKTDNLDHAENLLRGSFFQSTTRHYGNYLAQEILARPE